MPRLVRHAKEQLPGVSLTLQGEMLTPAMEAGLRDHTLDAAILRPPVASQDIEYRIVGREKLVVAMPSDSPLASGRPVAANELQEQNFVSYPPGSAVHRTVSEMCRRAGFQLRIAQVTHETSTMLSFVAASSGIAVVPESVRALQLEGVLYAGLEDSPVTEMAVAWRRDDRSALLGNFLNLVMDVTDHD